MFVDVTQDMALDRWAVFLKWAHERKYVASLYRPKSYCGRYCTFRIKLMLKVGNMPVTFESNEETLDKAIDTIKDKLLAFKPGEQ